MEKEEFIDVDPSQMQYAYPPMIPQKNDKADLLDKIKPDVIIDQIRHKLMGEELIDGKWVQVVNKGISKQGAWEIANLMLGVSSQNVVLSNLKDDEIRSRTLSIVETTQKMCLRNWKEYGIKGVDQLWFVHELVMSNTFVTLKQSQNEGIRNLIKGVRTETATINPYQKEGFISKLFRK